MSAAADRLKLFPFDAEARRAVEAEEAEEAERKAKERLRRNARRTAMDAAAGSAEISELHAAIDVLVDHVNRLDDQQAELLALVREQGDVFARAIENLHDAQTLVRRFETDPELERRSQAAIRRLENDDRRSKATIYFRKDIPLDDEPRAQRKHHNGRR